MSGAVTGTSACEYAPELIYQSSGDNTNVTIRSLSGANPGEWSGAASVTFNGKPVAQTFKTGDTGMVGDAEVVGPSGETWTAANGKPAKVEAGSMSVTISSIGDVTLDYQGTTRYACHGSFQGTLPADSGASGQVTLDATF